ncbi:MAG: ABC transporter ATP-binding protein [Candidatus Pacebacteria bacterium]|nr:ABC transporter ATP-binding protein [Candidatus Paceibacterota bacterium]
MSAHEDDAVKEPYPLRALVRDVWVYVAPYRAKFIAGSILRLLGDIAWLYPPLALATIINILAGYGTETSLAPVWVAVWGIVLATLVRYLTMYVAKRMVFEVSEKTVLDAERAGIAHMIRLPASWHERENTGNKHKRIVRGAEGLDRILRIWVNNLIEIAVNFVGVVIIIATFDPFIAGVTLLFLVIFYVLSHWFISRAVKASVAVHAYEEDVHGLLFESLNNIRTVRVLHMGKALVDMLEKVIGSLYEKVRMRIFWYQTGSTVRHMWGHMFRLAVILYIILGIVDGRYEVGFLVLFTTYFNSIWQSVSELSDVIQDLVVAKYSVARMMRTMREPVQHKSDDMLRPFPYDWKELTFTDVSFAYHDTNVLHRVSFTVRRGERVGLVGLSGAGKSTLFKLLLREHDATSGDVCVDGVPLSQYRLGDYYDHVTAVLQDTEVFNLSLRENIVLANMSLANDDPMVRRALDAAHVTDFLHKLPQGMETLIGEKGVKLSGGERQRVGIARAIFKRPDLLLLDEATSHLDAESEQSIQASLHELFRSVTAVVIAHRLSTVKEMDRILVLEHGSIVEEGTFEVLHAQGGRFHALWELQRLA